MAMLTCKLPLIVIVAPWKLYNEQIGVDESKYGVTGDPYLKVVKGHVTTFRILVPPPYLGNGSS